MDNTSGHDLQTSAQTNSDASRDGTFLPIVQVRGASAIRPVAATYGLPSGRDGSSGVIRSTMDWLRALHEDKEKDVGGGAPPRELNKGEDE